MVGRGVSELSPRELDLGRERLMTSAPEHQGMGSRARRRRRSPTAQLLSQPGGGIRAHDGIPGTRRHVRRSRGPSPPQRPSGSRAATAYARHSTRTGQAAHNSAATDHDPGSSHAPGPTSTHLPPRVARATPSASHSRAAPAGMPGRSRTVGRQSANSIASALTAGDPSRAAHQVVMRSPACDCIAALTDEACQVWPPRAVGMPSAMSPRAMVR